MAIDYNRGFTTIGPDPEQWGNQSITDIYDLSNKFVDNYTTPSTMIGDYMQVFPSRESRETAYQNTKVDAQFAQPLPRSVWETSLEDLAGALNYASNNEYNINAGDLSMGTPWEFYEGDFDWKNKAKQITASPNNYGVYTPSKADHLATQLAISDKGVAREKFMKDTVVHEAGGHGWDTIFGTPYLPLSEYGITKETLDSGESLATYGVQGLQDINKEAEKYKNARTNAERYRINPARYNAEANRTLTGYEDTASFLKTINGQEVRVNKFGRPLGINPNTASGEWGRDQTEYEQMVQSWARTGGRIIQDPDTGEYIRDDEMFNTAVKRFMDNPSNEKLGEAKGPLAEAVATSLTDIGYDTGYLSRNYSPYINKPEERWARLISAYARPYMNPNTLSIDPSVVHDPVKGELHPINYMGWSDEALGRGDATLSAVAQVLAENRRMGW